MEGLSRERLYKITHRVSRGFFAKAFVVLTGITLHLTLRASASCLAAEPAVARGRYTATGWGRAGAYLSNRAVAPLRAAGCDYERTFCMGIIRLTQQGVRFWGDHN